MTEIVLDFKRRFPKACSQSSLKGIGLASAGPMNVEKGILVNPVNFPGWKIVPIQKMLQKALERHNLKTHVYFQNDAMAAALAEGWVGSAKKMRSYAVVTVGTGIGSGVILNGRPCQSRGAGSEFGHMIINTEILSSRYSTRYEQSVEGLASGTALLRRARDLGFAGHSVEELVEANDQKYDSLFNDMSWALATLCYNLSIGFHLEGIFFSGGLIKIHKLYMKQTQKLYKELIKDFNGLFEARVAIAKTKNQAGILGAAYLPWQENYS